MVNVPLPGLRFGSCWGCEWWTDPAAVCLRRNGYGVFGAPRRPWLPNPFRVRKRLKSSGGGLRGDSGSDLLSLGLASWRAASSLE